VLKPKQSRRSCAGEDDAVINNSIMSPAVRPEAAAPSPPGLGVYIPFKADRARP
jgi:hypothetical protein